MPPVKMGKDTLTAENKDNNYVFVEMVQLKEIGNRQFSIGDMNSAIKYYKKALL